MSMDKKGGDFRNRYLITATLEALAPFHIGTGSREPWTDSNGTSVEVSTVVADYSGKPYIPGSSLKGALRQWSKEMYGVTEAWQNLFGSPDAEGKLEVWDAGCVSSSTTPSNPHLSGWKQDRLTYVAKSVALDPETGTAAEHKLYNFELVPEGACFQATFSAQNLTEDEAALVNAAINGFGHDTAPIVLGSMTKRGFGKFVIKNIKAYRLDSAGIVKWKEHVKGKETAGYKSIEDTAFTVELPAYKTGNTPNTLSETWTMRLETPLVVRSGGKFGWKNAAASKTRNHQMQFRWGREKGNLEEIGDLNFSIRLDGNVAKPYYHIPSAGIRGALREWAITNLLPREQWDMEKYLKELPAGQDVPEMMQNIISLFGFAVSTPDKEITRKCTRAGRLIISVDPFNETEEKPTMQGTWGSSSDTNYGPSNAKRHVKPRNPLDRITHAAKDGGLHNFLEFSSGQQINLTITIKEPNDFDLRFLEVVKREINDGMIRFGGLSGIGRGRVSVRKHNQEADNHGA